MILMDQQNSGSHTNFIGINSLSNEIIAHCNK